MYKSILAGICILTLAACGSGVDQGDGTDGSSSAPLTQNPIPEVLARNLQRISYNPDAQTLTVEVKSLDAPEIVATYARNAALDVPGYTAFSVQDDPLDRMFIALVAASDRRTVQAAVVGDGGQFNTVFNGGYYERTGTYSIPTSNPVTGLVSYAGLYAGVTNMSEPGATNLLPVPPGTPSELIPGQAARTQGEIFLNVSFSDSAVNGAIYNRSIVGGPALESVTLIPSTIDDNGEFLGTVEFDGDPATGSIGSYGGIFGGIDASDVAGVVYIDNLIRDVELEHEVGIFVLPRCGTAGDTAICGSVRP